MLTCRLLDTQRAKADLTQPDASMFGFGTLFSVGGTQMSPDYEDISSLGSPD